MQQRTSSRLFQLLFLSFCALALACFISGYRTLGTARASTLTAATSGDTIVYVKDNKQLRLIQPDGSNDRLIWQFPEGAVGGIASVAWRPDGQQIAFTSSHEATCSEWDFDIYLINPDGSNLHRLTNAPSCSELANYPQGSATVQVENRLATISQVLVYIEGAPDAKVVNIAPGSTVGVTFPQVADLGNGVLQSVVVINGNQRWFDAAVNADIVAGQNKQAGKITLAAAGFKAFGAYHVSWHPDGNKLAFQFGEGRLWQVGLDVPMLGEGGPLLEPQVNNSILGRAPVWSPVDNQVLYEDYGNRPPTIKRAQVDGTDGGDSLANVVFTSGIAWLSDGSGFVVADDDDLLAHTDLYLMKFVDNSITPLTQTSGHAAAAYPKVAPDSSQLVYVYVPDVLANPVTYQLRIMNSNGSNDHLLAEGGTRADWSRVAPQNPPATATPTATPPTQPTPIPTPTTTGNSTYPVYLPTVKR